MAAEFSLNTQMILLSKRMLWLSDGSVGFGQESDTAFSQGRNKNKYKSTKNILKLMNACERNSFLSSLDFSPFLTLKGNPCMTNISVVAYSLLFSDQKG